MQIGRFQRDGDAFVGHIRTLTLDVGLRIAPTGTAEHGRAPNWRVHLTDTAADASNALEVGAGWTHHSDSIGSYVTVQIDCPALPRPLRANLVPSTQEDGFHRLLWSPRLRRPKRD